MMSDLSVAEKLVMSTDHGLSGHLDSYSRRSFHLLKKVFCFGLVPVIDPYCDAQAVVIF